MSIPEPAEADFRHDIPHAYEMACVMLSEKGPFDSFIMGILRRAHHAESQLAASARDWSADHTHLQSLCRAAGVPEHQVVGDSHGVPGIADLADMLAAQLAALRAEVERDRDALLTACKAAERYDRSIAGQAARGEVDLLADGGGVASSDGLDTLYLDWSTKVRTALASR